ncbi:hypothetical protein BDR07DRAFT_1380350 [Suillus spraguei]|nr:hypothetical protein BDR07DRAFT_1380350 [Suillus spraguei]
MAPSLETSSVGQLPLPQPSPVKEVLHAICEHGHTKDVLVYSSPVRALTNVICQYHDNQTGMAQPQWNTLIRDAVDDLTTTSAAFLVSDTPITSPDHLPTFTSTPFMPTQKQKHNILDHKPETKFEQECQDALQDAYEHEAGYKGVLYGMQSTVEEKRKGKKQEQLVGDGLPRLLTGDEFYNSIIEHHEAADAEAERDECASLMKVWKEEDGKWLERNKVRRQAYKDEVRQWEAEQERAKLERQQTTWAKPKQGKLEAPLPKPTLAQIDDEEADEYEPSDEDSKEEH